MVYYKLIKITINILGLSKVIINMIVQYYDLSNTIVTEKGFLFTLKFWWLLCYFFGIKRQIFIAFYP